MKYGLKNVNCRKIFTLGPDVKKKKKKNQVDNFVPNSIYASYWTQKMLIWHYDETKKSSLGYSYKHCQPQC